MSIDDAARLLIADDDPDLLAAYVLYFSAHGFDIRTARNGLDALASRIANPYYIGFITSASPPPPRITA